MKQIYIIAEESELGIAILVPMTGINSRNVHLYMCPGHFQVILASSLALHRLSRTFLSTKEASFAPPPWPGHRHTYILSSDNFWQVGKAKYGCDRNVVKSAHMLTVRQ